MCILSTSLTVPAQTAEDKNRISELEKELSVVSGVDQIPILCELAEFYCKSNSKKALDYISTADKIASKNKANYSHLMNIYDVYGSIYYFKKNYKNAIAYYGKEMELAKKYRVNKNLAYSNFNTGIACKADRNYKKASLAFKASLATAQKMKDHSLIIQNYHALYETEKLAKNYKDAVDYHAKYVDAVTNSKKLASDLSVLTPSYKGETKLKLLEESLWETQEAMLSEMDSVLSEVSQQNMMLEQAKEQNEQEIENLSKRNENQTQELENTKEENSQNQEVIKKQGQIITYFIIGGIIVLSLLLGLCWAVRKNIKIKHRLESQKDEIEIQKNLIQIKNDQITDSINYARKIQDSILVPESKIKRWLTDMFIYYKPKDIVSGDFYWFSKYENKYVITAIDCTGHGVPGAFLSMIGNTLLHEIVNIKHVFKPDQILDMLHTGITLALNQDSEESGNEDGMDMSLCTVDTKLNRFQFAGAKNSLYVVQGDKLKILKANYYSIGGKPLRPDMKISFTCYDFMYDENTSIYMFSDGYLDQFGGEADEKFNTQRFKDMIIENRELPMEEQKRIFTETMEQWKGSRQQIDDFLVMGIKLSGIVDDDDKSSPKQLNS